MKTITIIGGGLAGLSLGIALRRNDVPVVVHEAGTYPRHRVCGEFINGVTDATLNTLGISDLLGDSRRLSSTVWHLNDKPFYQTELNEPAKGISRFQLDQRLANRFIELGGNLKTCSRITSSRRAGEVWAAGRTVDRKSRWLGLKVHVHNFSLNADLEMHLGSHGYVGLAPVEEGRANICGLFERSEVSGSGIELLFAYLRANRLFSLEERLSSVEHDSNSFTGISAFELGTQPAPEHQCVLGDSESMIPPFTGNGMSMAFEAAETGSTSLIDFATGTREWAETVQEIRHNLSHRFKTRLATSSVLHPFLLGQNGRAVLSILGRFGVLPFGPISRLLK